MSQSVPIADDPVPQHVDAKHAAVHVVSGLGVFTAINRELAQRCPVNSEGRYKAAELAIVHAQQAVRGFVGVEIRKSQYGYGAYYDSGLQGFDLISHFPTLPEAEAFAVRWSAADPLFRYVWMWTDDRK